MRLYLLSHYWKRLSHYNLATLPNITMIVLWQVVHWCIQHKIRPNFMFPKSMRLALICYESSMKTNLNVGNSNLTNSLKTSKTKHFRLVAALLIFEGFLLKQNWKKWDIFSMLMHFGRSQQSSHSFFIFNLVNSYLNFKRFEI